MPDIGIAKGNGSPSRRQIVRAELVGAVGNDETALVGRKQIREILLVRYEIDRARDVA